MSGLFKSTVIKGNRITDFAQTSATVGVPIPKIYGRAPSDGNVIFAPLPPKENRTVKRQGKGGVKQESFTYTLSYAIAFCQGPIYGYWWIKRNGKVVWTNDPAAPIEDAAYAAKWAQKATFYYGTASQLPDSTIESYKGTGAVSAFRYLAYIVVEDDDVTDNGGAVPSYEAVPIATPPEIYLTSKVYQQFIDERATATFTLPAWTLRQVIQPIDAPDELVTMSQRLVGWRFGDQVTYSQKESATAAFTLQSWTIRVTPTTFVEESATVTFSLPAWTFKLQPTTLVEEAATAEFTLQSWTFGT